VAVASIPAAAATPPVTLPNQQISLSLGISPEAMSGKTLKASLSRNEESKLFRDADKEGGLNHPMRRRNAHNNICVILKGDYSMVLCSEAVTVCRKDNKVSFGYSVMRGKRAGMEDFFYAEVICREDLPFLNKE